MPAAKYDLETRERALRLYHDALKEEGATKSGTRMKIGAMLDIKPATLHNWIRKAEADNASQVSLSEAEKDVEFKRLRRENSQLKEAIEILNLASAFSPRPSSTAH